jgi:hypothetical protein
MFSFKRLHKHRNKSPDFCCSTVVVVVTIRAWSEPRLSRAFIRFVVVQRTDGRSIIERSRTILIEIQVSSSSIEHEQL